LLLIKKHTYSLPDQRRLRKAVEFQAVLQNRIILSGALLRLYVKPTNAGYARIGLIVAKRIERSAVRRNRIKRILREAFRQHQQAVAGLDCVLQLRRPFALSDSARIFQEASTLLLKAKQP